MSNAGPTIDEQVEAIASDTAEEVLDTIPTEPTIIVVDNGADTSPIEEMNNTLEFDVKLRGIIREEISSYAAALTPVVIVEEVEPEPEPDPEPEPEPVKENKPEDDEPPVPQHGWFKKLGSH